MSKIKNYLACVFGIFLVTNVYAQNKDPNAYALMTARDMRENILSNITLVNQTTQPLTAYGLYIASYDRDDCSSCSGNILGGDNVAGAVASPVTFKVNQAVPIGQNFLYNMIYNGIYFITSNIGSSPCLLPGCSWPGDDTTLKWCVSINAASLDSNYTSSSFVNGSNPPANVPAYGAAGASSGLNYKYPLINPNTLGTGNACLGPITCNDKTLTCKVSTPQSESFQAYV